MGPEALAGKSINEIAKETGITRTARFKAPVVYADTFQFCARFQPGLKSRRTLADIQRVSYARRHRLWVLTCATEAETRVG